ncbi:MAG: DUF1523 family protein [Pseudomonadota bacterium]
MRYIIWTILALIVLFVGAFLHYTLPQHDIVRIVNTEVRRVSTEGKTMFWSSADADDAAGTRDVFFIDTIRENGRPFVLRNEDSGWIWPPYFKFDSANLQALAQDLVSDEAEPRWVAVRHYGWRVTWYSIFPNATSIWPVTGPDARIVPWFRIIFFVGLAGGAFWVWRLWRRFREDRVEPLMDNIDEAVDETRARGRGLWRRLTGR